MPPPMSSRPDSVKLVRPELPVDICHWSLTFWIAASIPPDSVTDDCADAAPAKAPSTARASKDFFIANISKVEI